MLVHCQKEQILLTVNDRGEIKGRKIYLRTGQGSHLKQGILGYFRPFWAFLVRYPVERHFFEGRGLCPPPLDVPKNIRFLDII